MKRKAKARIIFKVIFILIVSSTRLMQGQSVTFDLKTTPNLDFTFNTIDKYINGITIPHALELDVNVTGAQWDLYIGSTSITAGSWNVVTSYSSTGISPPPASILQARIYNANNTPVSGGAFFPVTDIATPTYIIGSIANDIGVNCGDASPIGTNQPGDFIADPECYRFKVDLKLVPGLIYRPGMYTIRVDFILIEDL